MFDGCENLAKIDVSKKNEKEFKNIFNEDELKNIYFNIK